MITIIIGVQRKIIIFRHLSQASVSSQNIEREVPTSPWELSIVFCLAVNYSLELDISPTVKWIQQHASEIVFNEFCFM